MSAEDTDSDRASGRIRTDDRRFTNCKPDVHLVSSDSIMLRLVWRQARVCIWLCTLYHWMSINMLAKCWQKQRPPPREMSSAFEGQEGGLLGRIFTPCGKPVASKANQ